MNVIILANRQTGQEHLTYARTDKIWKKKEDLITKYTKNISFLES